MAGRGGARINSGRPSKVEELKIVNVAIESISERYGSLKEGFISLLNSGEASLVKFVFEHAAGKPKERVDITSGGEVMQIIFNRDPKCEPIAKDS